MSIADTPIPESPGFTRSGQLDAMRRAKHFHVDRLVNEGHARTLWLEEQPAALDTTHPEHLGNGWWWIGEIIDCLDGALPRHMQVYWHPTTDAVRIDKPKPTPAPMAYAIDDESSKPIQIDANFHPTVDPGWRYWLRDVEYTPTQVRQLLELRKELRSKDWRWERVEGE